MTTLTEQVRKVSDTRTFQASLAAKLLEKQRAFEQENAVLIARVTDAKALVAAHEAELRTLTLRAFEQTGDKAPAPGVGIRLVKKVKYEFAQAFAWAKVSGMALTLDAKAFEKIAVATPLPCAEIEEIPQATIATDLAAALTGVTA
jgi:hypothetical protein